MELHQTKKLLKNKGTVTGLKRQPTERERLFASYHIQGAQKTNPANNQ
jgi:hypothetical protein